VKDNIDIKNMPIGISKRKEGKGGLILECKSEELKELKLTIVSKLRDKYQI
ncbi:hypothetical protein EAG_02321, partial [Camponotus floridanus]